MTVPDFYQNVKNVFFSLLGHLLYFSRFGGFALADEDWIKARDTLLERIGEQGRNQVK